jgi:hypothetical protein
LSTLPPAIRTRPSESRVAVWNSRTVVIEPVGLKRGGGVGEAVGVGAGVGVGEAVGAGSGVGDAVVDGVGLSIGLGVAVAAAQAARLAPINRTAISRPTLA